MFQNMIKVPKAFEDALAAMAEAEERAMKNPDCNRWIRSNSVSVFFGHDAISIIVRVNGGTWEWAGAGLDCHVWTPWVDCASREHAERNAMEWYCAEDGTE